MIGALAVLVVAAVAVVDRRRGAVPADAWPWLVAEVEGRVLRGEDPQTAAVAACLHGPPVLAEAVASAVAAQPADATGVTVLRAVAAATGDPRIDRLRTVVVLAGASGVPAAAVLRRLRERELDATAARRARAAAVGTGSAVRWLLLTPLVPVTVGALPCEWSVLLAATAVGAWWVAGRWLSAAVDADVTGTWRL